MLTFQVGDEVRRLTQGYGKPILIDFHRLPPQRVEAELTEAGFEVTATLFRAPTPAETVPQAVIIARYSDDRSGDPPVSSTP